MISDEKQRNILENYILPLFSGATLKPDKEGYKKGGYLVATFSNKLKIKFDKKLESRFVIERSQPFTGRDKNLVKRFIEKISSIDEEMIYAESLYDVCLEKSICEEFPEKIHKIAKSIIDIYTFWSLRTYEGRHPSFGIIVDFSENMKFEKADNLNLDSFLLKDYSAPLTDGISSFFRVNSDGYILDHETSEELSSKEIYAPYRFMSFADNCSEGKVGFVLLPNGEVLLFSDKEMKYAKRQGKWKLFDHTTSIKRLSDGSKYFEKAIRNAMYLTALDVSFSKTGGCLGYINKTQNKLAGDVINKEDVLIANNNKNDKSAFLSKLINNKKFHELSRKMRQELAGIDGATIIDNKGNIIACGTIIQNVSSDIRGGGRLAAAIQLSNYGTALKISADGGIVAYHKTKEVVSIG